MVDVPQPFKQALADKVAQIQQLRTAAKQAEGQFLDLEEEIRRSLDLPDGSKYDVRTGQFTIPAGDPDGDPD